MKAVRDLDAALALIVFDPLSVFLDLPASNEHGENATRRALLPFVELAQDLECGLVGIRHFNKGSAKDNPFDVVMGFARLLGRRPLGAVLHSRRRAQGPRPAG